jgi:hypothetical protein
MITMTMAPSCEDVVSEEYRDGKFIAAAVPPQFCAFRSIARKRNGNGQATAVYRQTFQQLLWKT